MLKLKEKGLKKSQTKLVDVRKQLATEEKRDRDVQAQLAKTDLCTLEGEWIEQDGGYSCPGGGHFVADPEGVL